MPECHKCPHNGKASTACLTCPGPANNLPRRGFFWCSTDARDDIYGDSDPMWTNERIDGRSNTDDPAAQALDNLEPVVDDTDTLVDLLATILHEFINLADDELVAVFARLRGEKNADTARRLKVCRASPSAKVTSACKKVPLLDLVLDRRPNWGTSLSTKRKMVEEAKHGLN